MSQKAFSTSGEKMNLILHIGLPKCGSTTLQQFMIRNQEPLRSKGIVIVDQDLKHPGEGRARGVAQVVLGQGKLLANPEAPQKISEALHDLHAQMQVFGDRTAVISGESLGNNVDRAEYFRPALALFNVTVIGYIRPQDQWLPSAWKQFGVRQGLSLPAFIEQSLARKAPSFLAPVGSWADVFGLENMIVHSMNRPALHQGDLIADFCFRLGWDKLGLDFSYNQTDANRTFDYHILSVLEQSPKVLDGANLGAMFNFLGEHLPEVAFQQGKVPLTPAQRMEIYDTFKPTNEQLLEKYMPTTCFEDAFGTGTSEKKQDVSEDLTTALARTVSYLMAVNMKQGNEIGQLRRMVQSLQAAQTPARKPTGQKG